MRVAPASMPLLHPQTHLLAHHPLRFPLPPFPAPPLLQRGWRLALDLTGGREMVWQLRPTSRHPGQSKVEVARVAAGLAAMEALAAGAGCVGAAHHVRLGAGISLVLDVVHASQEARGGCLPAFPARAGAAELDAFFSHARRPQFGDRQQQPFTPAFAPPSLDSLPCPASPPTPRAAGGLPCLPSLPSSPITPPAHRSRSAQMSV